jgi:hypothetical protein
MAQQTGLAANGTGLLARLARFGVSKAAGFGYAVAVGVATNFAFNYVAPHAAVPQIAAAANGDPAPAVATAEVAPQSLPIMAGIAVDTQPQPPVALAPPPDEPPRPAASPGPGSGGLY